MEDEVAERCVAGEGEPILSMVNGVWTVTGIAEEPSAAFRGVAFAPQLEAHCWTELVELGRTITALGSIGYEDAEREADVLRNQLALGL